MSGSRTGIQESNEPWQSTWRKWRSSYFAVMPESSGASENPLQTKLIDVRGNFTRVASRDEDGGPVHCHRADTDKGVVKY